MNSISSFTGLASGVQWGDLVDQILAMETQRQLTPLTKQVTQQQARREKWSAYETLLSKMNSAASKIRDRSAFSALQTAAGTSAAGKTLISASASSTATPGSYEVEVIALAKADKLSGSSFSGTSTQLGVSGEFYLNGRKVEIDSSDTLSSVRDKINAVNSGSSATGVTATILSTSSTEHRLVLSSDQTGARGIELVDGDSDVLESLGIATSSLVANRKPGDSTKMQSQRFSSTTTALASMLGVTAPPAVTTIEVDGHKITVDLLNDTMLSVMNKIQAAGGDASLTEEVVGGTTKYRLTVDGDVTADAAASDPAASQRIVELLGYEKKASASNITAGQDSVFRVDGFKMTRRTNTVSDAITGVSLNLLAANGSSRTSSVTGAGLSIATDPHSIDAGTYDIAMTSTVVRTTDADAGLTVLSAPATTSAGTYAVNITTAASVAAVTGAGFDGTYEKLLGSDTFTVTDSLGNVGSVTLTDGKTLATIVSELNTSFTSSGAGLLASDVGGQLKIEATGDKGSTSTFTVSGDADSAQLGIVNGVYTGNNVAGTIGGIAATGSGEILTGDSGAVQGLQVQYSGSATGAMGNVTVTDTVTVTGVTIDGVAATWDDSTSTITGVAGSEFDGLVLGYSGAPTTGTLGQLTVAGDIAVTLDVTRDLEAAITEMKSFATAYNAVVAFYEGQRANTSAPLYGNGSLRTIQGSLRESLLKTVEGLPAGATYTRGSIAGLALTRDGLLSVDEALLRTAMQDNLVDVKTLFGSGGTATHGQVSFINATSETDAGTYAVAITTAATQATHLSSVWGGTYAASDGVSDTLTITDSYTGKSVDFVATQGMSLSEAVTELTELFENNGLELSAMSEGGALRIRANQYGTASTFTLAGAEASTRLGLTAATYAGVDVAGTINGVAATGAGQVLTGDTGEVTEGLAIKYTGTTTGSMGSVSYVLGVTGNINRLVSPIVRSGDGTIATQLESIDDAIETLNQRASDVEARLELRRQSLEKQFIAMEQALSVLNSQSQWLSSQLRSLTPQQR